MAKASEQFRQSDVTLWGITALVLWAIAVMSANVSALLPQSVLAGLHKTRIEGASLDQLRQQVADLREEQSRIKRETGILTARFALGEQQDNDITRRVGALEVSLPRLLETIPPAGNIDRTTLTSAIGKDPALVYEAEGGSVVIRHQPMAEAQPMQAAEQPLPEPVQHLASIPAPEETAFGIAIGPAISQDDADDLWRDLTMKLGPLLFGMTPLLVDEPDSQDKRLVLGPISQLSEATALCSRLEPLSVACLPVPFYGTPLAQQASE